MTARERAKLVLYAPFREKPRQTFVRTDKVVIHAAVKIKERKVADLSLRQMSGKLIKIVGVADIAAGFTKNPRDRRPKLPNPKLATRRSNA